MTLDPGVLLLVLLAAVLHASWNALIKAGGDHLVVTAIIMFVPIPPAIAIVLLQPAMAAAAWPYVILSAVVHWIYFGVLIGAYRYGDFSQVYPIARGSAPAMVAFEAWIFEGEALSATETLGALIVSAGIVSLAWRRRGGAVPTHEPKAIAFALLTALTIAIYLLADGMGGRRSGDPLVYVCWLFILQGLPLAAVTLWRRRGRLAESLRPNLTQGILGGAIACVSYGIAVWAMSVAPLAHVVAVRETSVLFGAALGALVLKEPFGRYRILASAVVAAGAVLLNLGR
ncbi:MAG: DMT family transporter [Alphaproteobacteria bacterium]|nr:DMT family transporter [Alphaproteobacteria bacterium]